MARLIENPYETFVDTRGDPIEGGFIYIGTINTDAKTNQIPIFWDEELTIPAAQPLRVYGGRITRNGSPANVFTEGDYSIQVRNFNDVLVYGGDSAASDEPDTGGQNIDELFLSLKSFGAIGDYTTDDTEALKTALVAASGKTLFVPAGVYRITESIDIPDRTNIVGVSAPKIASFPQSGGDKDLLKPDNKHLINGSIFIFSGTANLSMTTIRSDKYGSATFCMRYNHYAGATFRDFAIIQDMDVRDASNALTTGATDNRADSYEVGLALRSTLSTLDRVTVFGYFDVAGVWFHDDDNNVTADPDYNKFLSCLITSGVAITGHDTAAGAGTAHSNTGGLFHQCGIYGADHHNRVDTDPDIPALYIDGYLTGSIGKIRGHSFNGCNFRALANDAIIFGRADDIQLSGCVWEFSQVSATGLDGAGSFRGSADTGDIWVFGGAGTSQPKVTDFIQETGGKWLFAGGGHFDGFMVGEGSGGVRISGGGDDSLIQLTDNFASTVSGWVLRRDSSDSDRLKFQYNNSNVLSFGTDGKIGRLVLRFISHTISSGAITLGDTSHIKVLTENGDSTDDLNTINGGVSGQLLTVQAGLSSDDVVLKDNVGNLRLNSDFTLNNGQDRIQLQYDGVHWVELSRSDNAG